MKKILFFIILVLLCNLGLYSQTTITIDTTISSSCELFPFSGVSTIYGLTMTGSISLNSDSSIVRIIYVDGDNNEWLLSESSTYISNDTNIALESFADETRFLTTSTPTSLLIYAIGANVNIESLTYSTIPSATTTELQEQEKYNNDINKINNINEYNKANNLRWNAGYNSIISGWYSEKKELFGEEKNYMGLEYYESGIFETVYTTHAYTQTDYVPYFDWRNRHDANIESSTYFDGDLEFKTGWITPVKDQLKCGACGVFSAIGSIEALANLYYNNPHLDLILSEQYIISCKGYPAPCTTGIPLTDVYEDVTHIYGKAISNENFPYKGEELACSDPLHTTPHNFELDINNHTVLLSNVTTDQLIERLINHGPFSVIIDLPNAEYHAVILVGYEINNETDEVFWLVKNSWNIFFGNNGFAWYSAAPGKLDPEAPNYPLNYYGTQAPEIVCNDNDGDGILWWGISETKPTGYSGYPDYCDCNDNDPTLGGYDDHYYCECLYTYDFSPYTLLDDELWDQPEYRNTDIVIPAGKTLTITSDVRMVETSRIIVEQGGSLIINGGTVRGMCGKFWNGIELRGTGNQPQSNLNAQGIVELKNNATIEDALIGIETSKNTRTVNNIWASWPQFSGGIIKAHSGSRFINCRQGVKFLPYPLDSSIPSDNESFFSEVDFLVNDDYLAVKSKNSFVYDLSKKFLEMIYMDGIEGVNFYGCNFNNDIDYHENENECLLGKGIYAVNSSFNITSFLDVESTVSSFEYGIFSITIESLIGQTIIRETYFEYNNTGIYISYPDNIMAPQILFNDIYMQGTSNSPIVSGIYIDNTNKYIVQENYLHRNGFSTGNFNCTYYGILINNCGEENNQIYNNTLEYLTTGIQAQDKNRNSTGLTGLEIKCNDYYNCKYDTYIVGKQHTVENPMPLEYGIKKDQGSIEYDPEAPANNIFHYATEPDYNDIFNNTHNINYFLPLGSINDYNLLPEEYSINLVNNTGNNNLVHYEKSTSCPQRYSKNVDVSSITDLHQEIDQLKQSADSINADLQLLTDSGDTETLNSDVQTSWPDETMEIRDQLLNASPYLSDTVILSIAEKEDVIPNSILTEVLVANPQSAKSDKILEAIDNRDTLLTQSQYDAIIAGDSIIGAKENLEIRHSSIKSKITLKENMLIYAWQIDSMVNIIDSIIPFLQSRDNPTSKYSLIELYLKNNDTTAAKAEYNSISNNINLTGNELTYWQNYNNWLQYRLNQANHGKKTLEPDSATMAGLYNMLVNSEDETKAKLINLLRTADTLSYNEPYLVADTSTHKNKVVFRPVFENNKDKSSFVIFPNPAKDYFVIDFNGSNIDANRIVKIIDNNGRITKEIHVEPKTGFKIIDTRLWKPGIYYIYIHGLEHETTPAKVSVIK